MAQVAPKVNKLVFNGEYNISKHGHRKGESELLVSLVLIAPGIISSAYYCSLKKISFKSVDFLIYSVVFMFLNNMLAIGVYFLAGHETSLTETFFTYFGTLAKYGLLTFVASITLPNILLLISKIYKIKKND